MIQLKENVMFGEHDRYKLVRLLGRGGFSEVWLCEDMQTQVNAALKIYAPGRGLDDYGITQFSNEFSIVFNLNHPNLLRPNHYDVFERMPYLTMPYCEQGSGMKLTGKLDEKTAWRFLHDVASGLAYLHEQNPPVIHQDIKPDNVLMNGSGRFLITDFGVSSKVRSTLRQSMPGGAATAGTIAYMGPERFGKDNRPVEASDVWSLGASLFELMTGEPPFGDRGGLLQKGGAEIPAISGAWPSKLEKLVRQCLQKEPERRPSPQAIVGEARRHLKPEPKPKHAPEPKPKPVSVPEHEPEAEPETAPYTKRFPWKTATASVILLIAAAAACFFGLRNHDSERDKALADCIAHIDKGHQLAGNELTWREAMYEYRAAVELKNKYTLQVPDVEQLMGRLQKQMDETVDKCLETARKFIEGGSPGMARATLDEAMAINPDDERIKTLMSRVDK